MPQKGTSKSARDSITGARISAVRFGWKRALPDHRDHSYAELRLSQEKPTTLPSQVDLRPGFPPIYNQGKLNACTANVVAAAFEFDRRKRNLPDFMPSRLFIYWNERNIEGTTSFDAGANIRDGIKVLAKHGTCKETEWPYKASQLATKPSRSCYQNALKYISIKYYRLHNTDLDELKTCLAAGFPFLFGFTVYRSFFKADRNGGIVPMPGDESIEGGHAVVAVGYSDRSRRFIIRNSWGKSKGDGGHYYMPYQYLTNRNLTGGFWTMRMVPQTDSSAVSCSR